MIGSEYQKNNKFSFENKTLVDMALVFPVQHQCFFVLADISVRSTRKSFIFITKLQCLLDQSISNLIYLILKTKSL